MLKNAIGLDNLSRSNQKWIEDELIQNLNFPDLFDSKTDPILLK